MDIKRLNNDRDSGVDDDDDNDCKKICGPKSACYRYIMLFTICLCGVGKFEFKSYLSDFLKKR